MCVSSLVFMFMTPQRALSATVGSVLETIPLDEIRFKGYAFQIEMKYTAHKIGFQIKEVPVIFVNRREGTSKMSGGIFSEALFGVVRLRIDGWFRKYPEIKD